MKKLFFILSAMLLLFSTTCSGSFIDPGMLDNTGGGGGFDDYGTIPSTPTSVTALTESSSSIIINWSAVSKASGYYVYRSINTSGPYSKLGSVTSNSYRNSGLHTSTYYYYRVSAFNSYGESSQSSYTSAKTFSAASENPTPLTLGIWTHDSSTSEVWYLFNVTAGTKYYVWWNDNHDGDGTKEADVFVSAYYGNGSSIFLDKDAAWDTPQSFTAGSSGTVKMNVYPRYGNGTFAIVYNTNSTRP